MRANNIKKYNKSNSWKKVCAKNERQNIIIIKKISLNK